jgi:hypothetical protein
MALIHRLMDVRFEGNTNDTSFGANSIYNVLRTGFFDEAKHADVSTANSNYVDLHGFATSATEAKELLETMDPKLASASVVCEAANRGYYAVIVPKRLFRASTIYICPTVQSGNVDVGIAPFGANVSASSGSTAVDERDEQLHDGSMTETQMLRDEVKHLHDCVEELKRDVKANGETMEKVRVILESFTVVGASPGGSVISPWRWQG